MTEKDIPALDAVLETLADEVTFLDFLDALGDDFARCSPSDFASDFTWVNWSVDTVLDAAVAWGRNSADPLHPGFRQTNPWQRCARILYHAKFYE